jgi:hypothetical protein
LEDLPIVPASTRNHEKDCMGFVSKHSIFQATLGSGEF